jgi:hypothetical protein
MSSRSASRRKRQERRKRLEKESRRVENLKAEEARRSAMSSGNDPVDDQTHAEPPSNGDDHSEDSSPKGHATIDSSSISVAMSRRVKDRAEKLREQHEDPTRPRTARKVKVERLTVKIVAFIVAGATLIALVLPLLI